MARRATTDEDYRQRLDRVIDEVHARLAAPPSLAELAKVAAFSPFHFHRVFKAMTHETVHQFVARARVERAALLLGRGQSERRLTDLALELGFSSSAELSRAFRARFGTTPSAFRREKRKNPQAGRALAPYRRGDETRFRATVVERPTQRLGFVRVTAPFVPGRLGHADAVLRAWASRWSTPALPLFGLSWDDPDVVPPERCRYDLALAAPDAARPGHGVSVRELPAGAWAELSVRGDMAHVERAWAWLFGVWLPRSGREPGLLPGVERFTSAPDFDTWRDVRAVLCLPLL